MNIVSADIGPWDEYLWNNSFDSVDETAGCYGKNIEIVLFLRNIFCGTETINNKEREQSFLSIKVWV